MNRQNYYHDFFQVFDDIFNDVSEVLQITQAPRFSKIMSTNDWPPANIKVDQATKDLTIEVALAGCEEEDINLSFDSDYLKLIVDRKDKSAKDNEGYFLQRGIRGFSKIETKWMIDPRYYNRDSVEVAFHNGLLIIKIKPREEVAPKKISLFGKLSLDEPKAIKEE